ncbi:MAG: hypothetical protein A7316_04400 [Candidatus Altiarchaeales archaeon WOR_SM1_86-2]|nr:MAG: hypothetical protein A7316_04400 [Candidatus Altiarchaeales archaeon WOR_SM1_86-2]ODS39892.1 MAG: hypothetical protein A7315_10225 [Candidatus Altiarchaeales archaeon WOR_SM1_79]
MKNKPLVLDSSPLIYLVKVGLSWVFGELDEVYIVSEVKKEVVDTGKSGGFSDAFIVEDLIKRSVLKVKCPSDNEFISKLSAISELHTADVKTLALAREIKGIAIIDEEIGRNIGKMLGIEVMGSAYMLFRMMMKGRLDKVQTRGIIDGMISEGWWCSAECYAKILKLIDEF